ncbi:unnamed protein product [Linum trigynum]|uniref:Uncharacterized protein n=1 Tax=Linum trigynum TaxID=586398 RepID=A0AAV2GL56_9ROSI
MAMATGLGKMAMATGLGKMATALGKLKCSPDATATALGKMATALGKMAMATALLVSRLSTKKKMANEIWELGFCPNPTHLPL